MGNTQKHPRPKMEDYQQHGLDLHNSYRARHGSPKLILSSELNQAAEAHAQKLAARKKLEHSSSRTYGENLYMATDTGASKKDHVARACESWYDENKNHNYKGDYQSQTGHFTAMVWKGSTELGIGCAAGNGWVVVVANYKPAGNMMGQFGANVLPGRETDASNGEGKGAKKAVK